ncbi:hypothetical protein EV694_1729 [Volucribacter psittacicida]|uniref:ATP-binding protein n=1 Tax=Volucribacter psittacicida TaxID=203482 RepID=A0A4R1FN30_9PAST|nr:hypothetical protein [Volucribacter psittacicida]TCJ96177.1 hypothetical protein EV694_1729 [Volucribacter psittacicida]
MNIQVWKSVVRKRTIRNLISKEKRHQSRGGKPKYKIINNRTLNLFEVIAPSKIILAREIGYDFTNFKDELELKAKLASKSKTQLKLNFRDTFIIDAPACSVLIAVLDTIKCQYPALKFKIARPKSKPADQRKHLPYDVDAVFCHIGLYKLLGFNYTSFCSLENVKCWHFVQSDCANGKITEPLFNELKSMGINDIYASYFEAIANAVEHAYDAHIPSNRNFPVKRWWMLMAVLEGKLSIFICDLGHGIPNTLEKTQKESTLMKIWSLLKLTKKPTADSLCIKASTLIKETRTELEYRGKGGNDIRLFIDKTPSSQLIIRSNRGMYVYNGKNKPDLLKESIYSLKGTVVQWDIPYPVR